MDLDPLFELAKEHNFVVIEDADIAVGTDRQEDRLTRQHLRFLVSSE